jgi:MFS family permease
LGFVADRLGSPRPVLVALSICSAGSAVLVAALDPGHGTLFLASVSALAGASVATWNGLYLAEAASLAPPESVSEAVAGTTFFVFLTYTVTPPIFGALTDAFGYEAAFLAAAAGAASSGVVLLSRRKRSGQ